MEKGFMNESSLGEPNPQKHLVSNGLTLIFDEKKLAKNSNFS